MILTPRYIPKLAAIIGLFTRYGLLDFAKKQGLLALQNVDAADDGEEPDREDNNKAKAFRKRLVALGPAYIKLGQVLSTRPDLLPPEYIRELENLQDNVPPMSREDVETTIEEDLGARISKLFSSFEYEPIGSASLGQVHAATLRNGREVVVKVQRPSLREQLGEDIEFFREMAGFLTAHTGAGERIDLVGVVQQVERSLIDELDYRTEAKNGATFRKALATFPHLLIPRVVDAYTTHRVLTVERIRGVKISEIPPITRIEYNFNFLAEEFARAYLHQIAVVGHFHADPHPGNVFVVLPARENPLTPLEAETSDRREAMREAATPLARSEQEARKESITATTPSPFDPKLALIDFGMTAHLTDRLKNSVVRLLLSIAENHGDTAAETLIEMGEHPEDFDRKSYVAEVSALIARNVDQTIGDTPAGLVLYEMIAIGYRRGLKLPAELTLLAKALFNLDAVTRALDKNFNPTETIREYTSEIANERAKRDLSPARMFKIATETSDLIAALPHRLDVLTARMAANDFAVRVDTPQLGKLLDGMQKIANRVFTGLVLAGLLVASGQLLPYWRRLGLAGFVIAAVIALYMIVSILVTDRKGRAVDK